MDLESNWVPIGICNQNNRLKDLDFKSQQFLMLSMFNGKSYFWKKSWQIQFYGHHFGWFESKSFSIDSLRIPSITIPRSNSNISFVMRV